MNPPPKRNKKKKLVWPRFVALRAILGVALLAIGVQSATSYVGFESQAVHSTGVVRKVERHVHTGGRRARIATVTPLIEFTPQGHAQAITAPTSTEERADVDVGDQVAIEYLPQRPEQSLRLDHGFPVIDGVVGVVGAFLLASAAEAMLRRRRIRQTLSQRDGQPIPA